MESKNIWTSFKNEIGYTTASIQYVELSRRLADDICGSELSGGRIQDLAKKYKLSVSEIPEDFGTRIAKNYIVQIHSCVMHFLNDFQHLIGSPTYGLKYNREKDNLLHWTMQHTLGTQSSSETYDVLYKICDYYRFARNEIIHSGQAQSGLRTAFSALSDFRDAKLHAPNSIDSICFDDQVLYARSARALLEAIYFNSQYDWQVIINHDKTEIKRITSRCSHEADKSTKKVYSYLRQTYPIPKEGIPNLIELI